MTKRSAVAWGAVGVIIGLVTVQLGLHVWKDHQDVHAMIRIINRASAPSR